MSATDFIIGAICVLVAIGVIAAIVQKGKEYDLKVFLSGAFWTMFFGIIVGLIASYVIEPREQGVIVGASIAGISYLCAAIVNIKKSNALFGLIFTTFQAVMTTCFFLVVLAVLLKFEKWRAGH